MSFPVWREWKHKWQLRPNEEFPEAYNVLSRLKGMETSRIMTTTTVFCIILQCPFPFEGNGNIKCIEHAFLNRVAPYNVLSRLKGMETI